MPALVVAAKQPEGIWVPNLQRPKIQNALASTSARATLARYNNTHFNTEITPVHVIAQEEITSLGRVAANFKQLHQVEVLAVDITAHCNGGIHLQEIWLALEHLRAPFYNPQCLLFSQSTFAIEMLLQKLKIRLAGILRGEKLLLAGRVEGWRLDI